MTREVTSAWTNILLSTALHSAKYSMAAAAFVEAGIGMLSALPRSAEGMIFDVGAIGSPSKPSIADVSRDDLRDYLCESRIAAPSWCVLAYSVIR
jgi:hypothetical protein